MIIKKFGIIHGIGPGLLLFHCLGWADWLRRHRISTSRETQIGFLVGHMGGFFVTSRTRRFLGAWYGHWLHEDGDRLRDEDDSTGNGDLDRFSDHGLLLD